MLNPLTHHEQDQLSLHSPEPAKEYTIPFIETPGSPGKLLEWLTIRIQHVLNNPLPGRVEFPQPDPDTPLGNLICEYGLSEEELVLITLAFATSFAPELLTGLRDAALHEQLNTQIGGFFFKGTPLFSPTIRTAVFLLAGQDIELRATYAARFHPRRTVFTSGLVIADPRHPSSIFLDYQLIFTDQFFGTALQNEPPRLDGDPGFPVKKSKALHTLSEVILKGKAITELEKLQRFARNMQRLWELPDAGKIRNNFISIFSGEPGTGKSYAAEAIGNECGIPVYKINFAQLTSKYIGETEKNLEKVFDRFDRKPCILFFDEAESIFSKRTEVNSSHDQHANNLQSYLLQKVEEFSGIIVMATNVQNLAHYFDKAFQRRFRSIVSFEFPDYEERLQIWERSLFEPFLFEKGLADRLAKNYQFSGGSIYNIVSEAIIECLDQDRNVITFELIEQALSDEFKKTSRKYEVCTDEMVSANPVRRFGPGYEQRRNF